MRGARLYGPMTGIVFTLGLLKSFLYLRVDPDAQHSGFVYAQAIAVSNGLLPNKNFLSPYGVTGPILNGLWLELTTDSLFSLLLLYGILTVITGYLIQRNSSRYLGRKIGILLNLTWVSTMATTIPWPSILSTLLCLISFTFLIENAHKFGTSTKASKLFLIPVVISLQISVLTRIQLALIPLVFSVYLVFNMKNLNKKLIRYWFLANLVTGLTLLVILSWLEILPGYVNQAIVWPLTEFSHPPLNLSWWFSLVWFPLSSFLLLVMMYMGITIFRKSNAYLGFIFGAGISAIFLLFYVLSNMEFSGSNTNTLRTFPGLLKNSSVNLQFVIYYSSATLFLSGIIFRLVSLRKSTNLGISRFFEVEHSIIMIIGLAGLSQLYPLKDTVHLWFIAPLLIVSAAYYFSSFDLVSSSIKKSLVVILSCLVLIQFIVMFTFTLNDREPFKSYELRGLVSNSKLQLGMDKSMQVLDESIDGRVLRNNCIDSLYAVAKGKYVSVDGNFSSNSFGNFTDTVPIVDPAPFQPRYVFECRISGSRIQEIVSEGTLIVFQSQNLASTEEDEDYFDVLFKKRSY